MNTQAALLLLLLTIVACFGTLSASSSERHQLCVHGCVQQLDDNHQHLCNLTCSHQASLQNLEVFVDGELLAPKTVDTLADPSFKSKAVKFDKNFYNTPAAFSDILKFKGELLEKFYSVASKKFVTPGHTYLKGTKLHMLPVPIPLTDSQLLNQEFMDKLLDIVPKEASEYKPVSALSLSESYREFLLSVKVDPANVQNAPKAPEVQKAIFDREEKLDQLITEYIIFAEKCNIAYEKYLETNKLTPISYTLEDYTPSNSNCKNANAKLDQHTKAANALSVYVNNLNPYNELFMAIGKTEVPKLSWNYAKSEIQGFTNIHRNMDAKGIQTGDSTFQIPVQLDKNFFNHEYFGGSSATYSEADLKGQLTFSGMGWKESPISPQSWFSLNALHAYRSKPQNKTPRNFFGADGVLSRIPTYILVAYKPQLKIKISRSMKDGFSKMASTRELRPVSTGSFVFTRVDLKENVGGKVNEEYEMVLSANLDQSQLIAFKSTPVVYIPAPPKPAPPKYLSFINRLVSIQNSQGKFISALADGDKGAVGVKDAAARDERWVVRDAGEGKVYFVSTHNTYLSRPSATAGTRLQTSTARGGAQQFIMIEEAGGKWSLKAAGNTLVSSRSSIVDVQPTAAAATQFTIKALSTPLWLQYANKRISIKSSRGSYLIGHAALGQKATAGGSVGENGKWRVVSLKHGLVGLLSTHGSYLRADPEQIIHKKKSSWFGLKKKRWTEIIPSRAVTQAGIADCSKYTMVSAGEGQVAFKLACKSLYLSALSTGEFTTTAALGPDAKFTIAEVK